ncbi:MAG: hypothetical protein JWP01_3969 [Myxococcales bacterium]|nr:hypothetical protein [Myxococcales bacterium]
MNALVIVLGAAVLALVAALVWLLRKRGAEPRVTTSAAMEASGRVELVQREPAPRGIPQWRYNIEFTEFIAVLSRELQSRLPEFRNDQKRLAERAQVSITTIDRLLSGETNATLHTLYQVCRERHIRLSELFGGVEYELQPAAGRITYVSGTTT